jgi:hypothetical protein
MSTADAAPQGAMAILLYAALFLVLRAISARRRNRAVTARATTR